MPDDLVPPLDLLGRTAPFDLLSPAERARLAASMSREEFGDGALVFEEGTPLSGLYIIEAGTVAISTVSDEVVTYRAAGDVMGERGLLRDGKAMLTARAAGPLVLHHIPAADFLRLMSEEGEFARWFGRAVPTEPGSDDGPYATGLTALSVSDMMAKSPVTCSAGTTVTEVARIMRDRVISSVLVMEDEGLAGIVTVHDLTNKVLAEGLTGSIPVADVMTRKVRTVSPDATGLDALVEMASHRINHLPVSDRRGRIVGMIGKTDLFRRQAATASHMVAEIVAADAASDMARVMTRLPELLSHLVSAGAKPAAITRRITDLTDAATRRLLVLAEDRLGPPPVPYLWAACGSQGRREQTGVSDQDNCLILDDAFEPAHDAYFRDLAAFVSDGLDEIGFVYCPGEMMATTDRWRQPRRVWRRYFQNWIAEPDTEAQMLASVMFDLRPISGEMELFHGLQRETLDMARKNSIFVGHMIANSLKHTPPLGLFRGLATIRSGEHKNTVDLKMAGVVPVVDLARVYALRGGIEAVNTRERIIAAGEAGIVSATGARDLVDAYDLIAETRLRHQAAQIAAGERPDNFMAPGRMSDLERSHLRDAFMVVKTMQAAVGHGASLMG
ncbi:putative nucleotidyltransferase substrate binding domain-containing protein [Histidinibacterium lentulum]|uniref:CBS domain-containing protein n=1 Tax=Histidinibacterium lentulum TaxID=2480588 RepID=A0A3N2QSA1_9RHOB|nr:putative nucleotidyltransferase substrate binding domain-containing protein [Histidinibacterium lentulum]ROT98054.1 CBS domain-containing protein [Histidinibacterium lentulum]